MSRKMLSAEVLKELATLDTPTVCNALEVVMPDRRGHGFTVSPLFCAWPDLPSMVGYARTARIRAVHRSDKELTELMELRGCYFEYVEAGARPTIAVIEDLDGERAGYGSFWGEVNTHVHRGLGCVGTVTNGSIRDLCDSAPGFQMLAGQVGPSHAYVHIVDFGVPVTVAGMEVCDGDLIHGDRHGSVVIPHEAAEKIKEAAGLIVRREAVIIKASKQPDFDVKKLRAAWAGMADIH